MREEKTTEELSLKYLKLLSEKYPTIQSVASQIINLNSICDLPKGTEHFMSDLHGEHEAFSHILNNCSGVIREKIDILFGHMISVGERENLATLVYYPEQKMALIKKSSKDLQDWYRITLQRLIELTRHVASKYTRTRVRRSLPRDFGYIIDELLHTNYDLKNKEHYYDQIISTIIQLEQGDAFIVALTDLIKNLAVDRLHIIGDIFDRGQRPDIIMDQLMEHHCVDIQWGNHDILWMGAAAGVDACIANVLNVSMQYNNMELLENAYGISLRQLAVFAQETYKDGTAFKPKVVLDTRYGIKDADLISKMRKAVLVMQFKLEGQIILRNPDFAMGDRLFLHKMDLKKGTAMVGATQYPLKDSYLPTVNSENPYQLTVEEKRVMDNLHQSFVDCEKLQKHIRFLYAKGGIYRCYNGNLLYHGCVPMEADGSYTRVSLGGKETSGRKLMDHCESLSRQAYFSPEGSRERQGAMDCVWYLWCGKNSPLFGRNKMTSFERAFLAENDLIDEPKNSYYTLFEKEEVCKGILREFGLSSISGHIMNGHVPVKTKEGESPIKANGKLLLIDGGFCRAYHPTTGIAGYTLIFNSYGMRIIAHEPFVGVTEATQKNKDIHSISTVFESRNVRIKVAHTDKGKEILNMITDLEQLLSAYRKGQIKQVYSTKGGSFEENLDIESN